uniref:Uncharacterized protein n=1 Tax=Anopheles atroparvus TaxID=41427 RepID=A0AAG5DJ46_ANOAO
MVFSSYNSTSYLPLDNDQSVTFYKNENRLFPTAIVPPTVLALPPSTRGAVPSAASNSLSHMSNMSTTDMLTAAYEQQQQQHHHHHLHRELIGGSGSGSLITGDCPFGRVQSPAASATPQQHPVAQHQHHHRPGGAVAMCDDFQPVAYLNGSSNGYYGYVPTLTPAAPGQNNRQNTLAGRVETGVHRSQETATVAPPDVHLPSVRFHGNGGCNDNELNNNNNNNNDPFGGEVAAADPFSTGSFLQHARKRKENGGFTTNLHQRYEEDMDTNASAHTSDGASETKRRKTEPEVFAERTNDFQYPVANVGDPYSHGQKQQQAVEMECQDQQEQHHLTGHSHPEQPPPPAVNYTNGFHSQHTPGGLQPASSPFATVPGSADGHQHQHSTSKSKYFDSSRCMMSHMI